MSFEILIKSKINCNIVMGNTNLLFWAFMLASAVYGSAQSTSMVWTNCPADRVAHVSRLARFNNVTFQCTTIQVPLDWTKPASSKTINYFILRAYNSSLPQPPAEQLWMIQGGPGASGAGLEDAALNVVSQMTRQVTVYVPDNRGTGMSSCLGCNITECHWKPNLIDVNYKVCAKKLYEQYGTDTTSFTTTNGALDVDYAMSLLKKTEQVSKIYIYGLSYGTYFVNRFTLIAKNKPDAVILDGVCPADLCRLDLYDKRWNVVARSLFILCSTESKTCKQNLGPEPIELAELVQTHFEQKLPFCNGAVQLTHDQFNKLTLRILPTATNRELLPPLINRLIRCSPTDIKEVNYAFKLSPTLAESRQRYVVVSLPTMVTITLSEIYDSDPSHPLSLEEHSGIEKTLLFSPQISMAAATARPYWQTYQPDQFYNQYYPQDTPTLILQGTLDPQTPHYFGIHAKTHYNYPDQHLVSIPYAPHITVRSDKSNCAAQVMASFLNNPTGTFDTSCTTRVTPIDFEGVTDATKQASQVFFGTPLLWGTA